MIYCSNCGFENIDDSNFCVKCGNPFLQSIKDAKKNQERLQQVTNQQLMNNQNLERPIRKKKRIGLIIGVIISVVIAVIAIVEAVFLFCGSQKEEMEPHAEVIKNFEEALNDKDVDKYIEVLPLGDEAENAKVRESAEKSMRMFNRNVNYKFEIINKTHLEREDFDELEDSGLDLLSDFGADDTDIDFHLTDGYRYNCEYSYIDWNGEEIYDNATIKVGKWNGKWYIFDLRL